MRRRLGRCRRERPPGGRSRASRRARPRRAARITADARRNVRRSVRERTRLGRAVCPACAACAPVSARTRTSLSARVQSAAVELDVVFLGTSGSMPTAKRALSATLVRRGGDRLLVRLLGGHAAAAPAQRRRPRRARGDLPHALPRRPLPRPPGDAEDLRAAGPRGAADDLRAAGPRRALRDASAHLRPADVSARGRGARGRAPRSSGTGTGSRPSPSITV